MPYCIYCGKEVEQHSWGSEIVCLNCWKVPEIQNKYQMSFNKSYLKLKDAEAFIDWHNEVMKPWVEKTLKYEKKIEELQMDLDCAHAESRAYEDKAIELKKENEQNKIENKKFKEQIEESVNADLGFEKREE